MNTQFLTISLVSGCWNKIDDEEVPPDQSVFVEESQVRVSKIAAATQKTYLCKWCFSVLEPIVHLTGSEGAHEQNAFFSEAGVNYLFFCANFS